MTKKRYWSRSGEHARDDPPVITAEEAQEQAQGPLAKFRAMLDAGDYDGVLGEGLRLTLSRAAADDGLEAEIGALRLALARLLREEHDPGRLAAGVARIGHVAVQAARVRHGVDADLEHIQNTVQQVLEKVEKDYPLNPGPAPEGSNDDTDGRGDRGGMPPRPLNSNGPGARDRQRTDQPGTGLGLRSRDAADGPRAD